MKVIVHVIDSDLTNPLVFGSLAAFLAHWAHEEWEKEDQDYPLMVKALEAGDSFADASSWVGWVDVQNLFESGKDGRIWRRMLATDEAAVSRGEYTELEIK